MPIILLSRDFKKETHNNQPYKKKERKTLLIAIKQSDGRFHILLW